MGKIEDIKEKNEMKKEGKGGNWAWLRGKKDMSE
jgi:hypothetical protein